MKTDNLKSLIIDTLKAYNKKRIRRRELFNRLGKKKLDYEKFTAVLTDMVKSGDIIRMKGRRYSLPEKSGLVTGTLLAVARISGETAPLLFTALNSPYWPRTLAEPMANLTVTIFNYAMSPFKVWQEIAWGASLVIMVAVLALNLLARLGLSSRRKGAKK